MSDSWLSGQRRGRTTIRVREKLRPEQMLRLSRMARELRLTDQILSDDVDQLSVLESGPAPAWTTLEGDHICFAFNRMPFPRDRVDVAVWLGTNAHELGHSLFSPRRDSILMRRVMNGEQAHLRGIVNLHNIVEDQRQERLLLARFSPWRAYLVAALGHHIKDEKGSWVLLAGRTWLPAEVRAEAKAKFVARYGGSAADLVAEIVGKYQKLTDPGNSQSDEAWDLLIQLHDLFPSDQMPEPTYPCEPTGSGEPDTSESGDSAPETADEADDEPPWKPPSNPGDKPEGSGSQSEEESDDQSQDPGEGDGSPDEGSPAGSDPGSGVDKKLREALREAVEKELAANEQTKSDLDNVLDVLDNGQAGDGVSGDDPVGRYYPATDTARRLHWEVADALRDLKDECEPGWDKRVDSGRLNVRRLTNPRVDPDELFDKFNPGQMEAAELELVLLLDVSGSMSARMHRLAEATWAIRHACDDIDATATVLTFDSGPHRVLAHPWERPDERMFVPSDLGGTDPASALGEAYRLTCDSTARNRLVVILTDGSWYDPARSEQTIEALNERGVVTVLAQLGAWSRDDHGCRHYAIIDDLSELARVFQKAAIAQMESWR